jgi:glycosyltransferase involved in cell wall biosynthesis
MSKPKEIIFLLSQDLESPSGLGRYRPMAKELAKRGFVVRIVALHPDYERLINKAKMIDDVEVHYVSQMHVKKYANETAYFPWWKLPGVIFRATSKLYRKVIEYQPDYIIVGKPHPMNGLAGIWAAKKTGAKLIVDCDDYEKESNHYTSAIQKALVGFFETHIPRKAWKVTTNTFFMRDKLIEAGVQPDKIIYLSNGVDRDRFSNVNPTNVEKLRLDFGLSGKKVVLYIGSLNLSNHPVDMLLKAFVLVKKAVPEARLLIVGGGKDLDTLKLLAKDLDISESVVFTGRVASELAPLYYSLADVSVDPADDSPASSGRAPLKIFESWAMGVPVVTSDVGDRKILADRLWGPIQLVKFSTTELSYAVLSQITKPKPKEGRPLDVAPYFWDKLIEGLASSLFDADDL